MPFLVCQNDRRQSGPILICEHRLGLLSDFSLEVLSFPVLSVQVEREFLRSLLTWSCEQVDHESRATQPAGRVQARRQLERHVLRFQPPADGQSGRFNQRPNPYCRRRLNSRQSMLDENPVLVLQWDNVGDQSKRSKGHAVQEELAEPRLDPFAAADSLAERPGELECHPCPGKSAKRIIAV